MIGWINPFFADSDPNGYSDCVKNYRFLENAYKNGDCKPILKQKHSSGDTTCTIEYYEEDSNTKKDCLLIAKVQTMRLKIK